jgi:recombinational DNA repair ATPase RecF
VTQVKLAQELRDKYDSPGDDEAVIRAAILAECRTLPKRVVQECIGCIPDVGSAKEFLDRVRKHIKRYLAHEADENERILKQLRTRLQNGKTLADIQAQLIDSGFESVRVAQIIADAHTRYHKEFPAAM